MRLRSIYLLLALAGMAALPAINFAAPAPRALSPVAAAAKNLEEARAKLAKAKGDFDVIKKRLAINFEVKPEWKAAKDSLDDAKSKYDSAAKKVLAALEKDPAYKEQIDKRAKAQAIVDSSNKKDVASSDDTAKVTDDDINKAQTDRVSAAIELKKMEHDAHENDATLVAARQKLKSAQDTWDALESQLDDAVKLDPGYPPIKIEIEQAEAGVKTAQDAYNNAVKAAGANHPRSTPRK